MSAKNCLTCVEVTGNRPNVLVPFCLQRLVQ